MLKCGAGQPVVGSSPRVLSERGYQKGERMRFPQNVTELIFYHGRMVCNWNFSEIVFLPKVQRSYFFIEIFMYSRVQASDGF